ncbi:hypothetical protein Sfulv_32930 [Streptomyces fulvorobeus]|uniref:Uncharacterized protein n=1 Tax=Streptomyces fulvorobeus TaxID=284028 RepID=A0A7J0C7M2_9ACTN|nr:hypothetical protein Sfulv_32930 [Streptomyces fulvorobeus]
MAGNGDMTCRLRCHCGALPRAPGVNALPGLPRVRAGVVSAGAAAQDAEGKHTVSGNRPR